MKKTNRPIKEKTTLFAFLPEDGEIHLQYAKQLKNEEPMSFEETGTSIASIGDVFERMMSDFRRMTVEEHLGFPDFPDADTLTASEIERELFEVLDMLEDHNILIDTNADYPDEDLYRFITGELMQEEIFGPILPIITYKEEKEIEMVILKYEKPLALYVFSDDRKFARKTILDHSFGGGCINDTIIHFANRRLPFGGVGHSGMGAYHGQLSFNTFSHHKAIVKKANWLDLNFRYAPYSNKINSIRKFLNWL